MRIVLMCPKCGLVRTPENDDRSCDICEYCSTDAIRVDFDVDVFMQSTEDEIPSVRERVWKKFLYNNSQYNETIIEKRLEEERIEHQRVRQVLDGVKSSTLNTPKCPYCNSFYVEKITTGGRLLSTAMFGLGSSKVGKQWHCQSCKSNF